MQAITHYTHVALIPRVLLPLAVVHIPRESLWHSYYRTCRLVRDICPYLGAGCCLLVMVGISGGKMTVNSRKWSCGVCGKGIQANSV